jgi:hypothetical protein
VFTADELLVALPWKMSKAVTWKL